MNGFFTVFLFAFSTLLVVGGVAMDHLGAVRDALKGGTVKEKIEALRAGWKTSYDNINDATVPMDMLLDNLKTKSRPLKRELLVYIGKQEWKSEKVAEKMLEIARNEDEDKEIRASAIFRIASKCKNPIRYFSLLVKDKSPYIREKAATSLQHVRTINVNIKELQALFVILFGDRQSTVRSAAYGSLFELGQGNRRLFFVPDLRQSRIRVYFVSAALRCNPNDITASEALFDLLEHEDQLVREQAAVGISECRRFSPLLIKRANAALKQGSPIVRASLCIYLCDANPSDGPSVNHLHLCLMDDDFDVRWWAARAAGRLLRRDCVPLLVPLLEDKDTLPEAALESLILLGDNSPTVVEAIQNAGRSGKLNAVDVNNALNKLQRK